MVEVTATVRDVMYETANRRRQSDQAAEAVLTAGRLPFRTVGQPDDVSVPFQDENLVVTTRH